MRHFLVIIKAYWQRALTYRMTVLAYRVGELGEVLILIVMWSAIYRSQGLIQGFTLQEMITYVLVGNVFHAIIRNFLSGIVARDIREGRLSISLIKPMHYFSYILAQEIGRISLATLMSFITQVLVILFFLNTFQWNWEAMYLAVIVVMVFLAFITELLLAYLVGLVAFWTDEVEGLYATTERIKKFFSGGYFPLSLLPGALVQASFLLPFAYAFFVPAQLYLKKLELSAGLRGIAIQLVWIVLLFVIIQMVWQRGLRRYEGVGI